MSNKNYTALLFVDENQKTIKGIDQSIHRKIHYIVIGSQVQVINFKETNSPNLSGLNITFVVIESEFRFSSITQMINGLCFIYPEDSLLGENFTNSLDDAASTLYNSLTILNGFYLTVSGARYSREIFQDQNPNIDSIFSSQKTLLAPHNIIIFRSNILKKVNFILTKESTLFEFKCLLNINYLSEIYAYNNYILPDLNQIPSSFISKIKYNDTTDIKLLNSIIKSKKHIWTKRRFSKVTKSFKRMKLASTPKVLEAIDL